MNSASPDPFWERKPASPPVLGPAVSPRGAGGRSSLGSVPGPPAPFPRVASPATPEPLPAIESAPAAETAREEELPWLVPEEPVSVAPEPREEAEPLRLEAEWPEPEDEWDSFLVVPVEDLAEPAAETPQAYAPEPWETIFPEPDAEQVEEQVPSPLPVEEPAAAHDPWPWAAEEEPAVVPALPEPAASTEPGGAQDGEEPEEAEGDETELRVPPLNEVADRLERIARALRYRASPEVLGAEADTDPLQLLITGYAVGYSEAVRAAEEKRRREGR